ncbi:hypothetical protein JJC03_03780 [Flavobacterium oreochromis]|uniref:hypothetical protein n=1 Tax=Flavobacterium oreochromis TaxID=2906078 RepID=UPI001CE4BE88|nr:hypothetical protein [Flavobacterium oreochromis]QYS87096.1 hypothetical protein JJC03_03780 [Flavobacterium oreochromis]
MKLIGNKEEFAVQYEITDKQNWMGYSKVWFGDNPIGTDEDIIYIKGYLIKGLEKIGNSYDIDMDYDYEKETLFKKLEQRLKNSNDDQIRKYLVIFGTFCDDFTIFSFLIEDEINIIWKLNSNDTPFTDLSNLDLSVNHFKIKKTSYLEKLRAIKLGMFPDGAGTQLSEV